MDDGPPYDFTVTLEKRAGCRNVGLKIVFLKGSALTVQAVDPTGLVPDWNLTCAPEERIVEGCQIVSVNGIHETVQSMFVELKQAPRLTLGISRAKNAVIRVISLSADDNALQGFSVV